MPMSPGNQAIVGGTVLRIPAIQSPDFVPGVSGWIIRQDGSAEFNVGTFRGSIEVGSLTGQHFWVNNPNTGDVIDVYNSSNQLVFSIDSTGRLVSESTINTSTVVVNGGALFFEDTAQSPTLQAEILGFIGATQTALWMGSGVPAGAAGGEQPALMQLIAGQTQASTWAQMQQRGFTGPVLQGDSNSNTNQLHHLEIYNVATGPGGDSAFAHHCSFTPTFGFLVGINGVGANFPFQYAWFANPFTSTTAHAVFTNNLGANLANTTLGVMGEFWG
jgi:hypothetical protein